MHWQWRKAGPHPALRATFPRGGRLFREKGACMLSKKRNGWLWVVMLFAVCAVVYGVLSSYPRELAVYSDELRYLDVARSLLQGRGLRVRNMTSDYQKILYPLCILPALLLKTTAAQITAIGWLNAVYMACLLYTSPSPRD